MATKIEWTGDTWNPTTGCTRASSGCDNCYAFTMTKRLAAMGQAKYQGLVGKGHFNGVMKTHDDELQKPLRWKKPRRVFVNSMSDLFHKDVPFEFIDKVFAVMALCPQHTFQVLTKRPERMAEFCDSIGRHSLIDDKIIEWHTEQEPDGYRLSNRLPIHPLQIAQDVRFRERWPLPNMWLGCSVENQQTADERIPHLLRCPAAVRFLSCEPLLGPLILHKYFAQCECGGLHGFSACPNTGRVALSCERTGCTKLRPLLKWLIVGGESGHHARPFNIEWARSLVAQCKTAGVRCFVKQLGANVVVDRNDDVGGGIHCLMQKKLKDKKGGNPEEWPDDLRVREYPQSCGTLES